MRVGAHRGLSWTSRGRGRQEVLPPTPDCPQPVSFAATGILGVFGSHLLPAGASGASWDELLQPKASAPASAKFVARSVKKSTLADLML